MFCIIRFFLIPFFVVLLAGCNMTSLMFYPLKNYPVTPDQVGLAYETIHHTASDGTQLVSWWMPAVTLPGKSPKGSVVYLHGNAQNISYHQFNVNWLPQHGFNVFLLGYRQYGESQGIAKIPNVFLDIHSALDWVNQETPDLPLFVLGQSMGASLSVFGLASYGNSGSVKGVVLDAVFDSYPGMAAEAMSTNWLTWLLQFPAYLMTDEYDPIAWIQHWPRVPLLMMHSPEDQVVPYERGKTLFDRANEPKYWIENEGPHIATFSHKNRQIQVLEFLSSSIQDK